MFLRTLIRRITHNSDTKAKIIENLLWSVLGKLANLASGLIVGIIVARYLGPSSYGVMNYVISYVFIFQTLAVFGLDSIEVREESRATTDKNIIIGTAFAIKITLGIVAMLLCVGTSLYMDSDARTTMLVAIYSFTILLNAFSVIRNHFMAILDNKYVVMSEISRTAAGIVLKLILIWADASLTWFVTIYMLDYLLLAGGYISSYRSRIGRISLWRYDHTYARFLIKESFPLLLTSAAVIIYQRIDQVMIGQIINKESVAYFSVASRFVEVLIYIPMMLSQTITPVLVRIREQSVTAYIEKAQQFMNFSLWATLLLSAVTSLLAYWIVRLTYGTSYLPAVAILQVMAFKGASVALSNTAGAMLVAERLQRYAFLRDITGCIVCVVLNYVFLPRYGVIAAAYIAIISNVAAGYLADAAIPAYRHLFRRQTKALLLGWKTPLSLLQARSQA